MKDLALIKRIENKIYFIRGQNVMLDQDLAELYEVETKALKQQVKRNIERFPPDFMLELTKDEFKNLRSQIVTSSWGGQRYLPYTFTEQGVAMLSSVLRSKRAIYVNIQIMRAFTKLRELLATHKDLQRKIEEMEKKYDQQFKVVFDVIKSLLLSFAKVMEVVRFSVIPAKAGIYRWIPCQARNDRCMHEFPLLMQTSITTPESKTRKIGFRQK